MPDRINDNLAGKLEAAGLWRRAASRWLDVMLSEALSDRQRDWVRERRTYCLSRVAPVVVGEALDMAEIGAAATAALERMGLCLPNGAAFRSVKNRTPYRLHAGAPEDGDHPAVEERNADDAGLCYGLDMTSSGIRERDFGG